MRPAPMPPRRTKARGGGIKSARRNMASPHATQHDQFAIYAVAAFNKKMAGGKQGGTDQSCANLAARDLSMRGHIKNHIAGYVEAVELTSRLKKLSLSANMCTTFNIGRPCPLAPSPSAGSPGAAAGQPVLPAARPPPARPPANSPGAAMATPALPRGPLGRPGASARRPAASRQSRGP